MFRTLPTGLVISPPTAKTYGAAVDLAAAMIARARELQPGDDATPLLNAMSVYLAASIASGSLALTSISTVIRLISEAGDMGAEVDTTARAAAFARIMEVVDTLGLPTKLLTKLADSLEKTDRVGLGVLAEDAAALADGRCSACPNCRAKAARERIAARAVEGAAPAPSSN